MRTPTFADVADFLALTRAARRAARGKALTAEAAGFLFDLEIECLQLERELRSGLYRPGPYRTFRIRDPKPRTISAAPFRDRVVHHALCAALEPAFEARSDPDSFACRTVKGTVAALRRVEALTREAPYCLCLDIEHCFESIDHGVLGAQLREVAHDEALLALAGRFIAAGAPGSPPGRGLPIGNLTSQHFANFHLTVLDRAVRALPGVRGYVRYMDDLRVFGERGELRAVRAALEAFVPGTLGLTLKARATRLLPVACGVPFLGFVVYRGTTRLDGARVRRFRAGLRRAALEPVARRAAIAQSLCAWVALADTAGLRASLFRRHPELS